MDDQELQGRINGLMLALEVALIETLTLKHGDVEKAIEVASSEIGGIATSVENTLAPGNFRTGTVDSLRLIVERLQTLYSPTRH